MIKAFLFDYGGVITDGGRTGLSDKVANQLNISKDTACKLFSPVWDLFIRGKITEDEL